MSLVWVPVSSFILFIHSVKLFGYICSYSGVISGTATPTCPLFLPVESPVMLLLPSHLLNCSSSPNELPIHWSVSTCPLPDCLCAIFSLPICCDPDRVLDLACVCFIYLMFTFIPYLIIGFTSVWPFIFNFPSWIFVPLMSFIYHPSKDLHLPPELTLLWELTSTKTFILFHQML